MKLNKDNSPINALQSLMTQLETCAKNGDWQEVQDTAVRIQKAVMQIPAAERRQPLLQAQRSIEAAQATALAVHGDLGKQLSTLRRGQNAVREYQDSA